MHNKTLLTYMDRTPPRTLYYKDRQGKLRLNGFVARFVMLFAERFNANLQMAFPLNFEDPSHYSVIIENMVNLNRLDIPMVMDTSPTINKWYNMTNSLHHDKGLLVVPCAKALSKREVYGKLLNGAFLGYIIICTMALSLARSLIDYVFNRQLHFSRLLFSELIFPGVLGQPFSITHFSNVSSKIIYLLLFIAGLYLNTLFAVSVSTLFTHPPKHRQIETMQDLVKSPLQILLYDVEARVMQEHIRPYRSVFTTTNNYTYVLGMRNSFNSSFGYYFSYSAWLMMSSVQSFYQDKIFCTYENLTLFPNLRWAIPLPHNSPYKEGLNYLIELVKAFGLLEAWHYSTFFDMLRHKELTISEPQEDMTPKALTMADMFWIWIIIVVGLTTAMAVFLMEIIWNHRNKLIKSKVDPHSE
ncbi:uncharacterized protein LOC133338613 [Musca vetustissima]|uniref:uncharacterized protein LOC133338613 n=1 Tax=Musca vetustissima TaxID=27455 RepID=UPI002AB693EC|nr:uncharacterized protein LOC133338613 [Musca vetustissima]